MTKHSDSTEQHQLHHTDLVYADEATLIAASPSASLYHRVGYATSERTYWLWTQDGWYQLADPQAGSPLSRAAVHDDAVVTHNGEIVVI